MKKYFIIALLGLFGSNMMAQLTIGNGAQLVISGNQTITLQDIGLVNNGSVIAGTGGFKFTGSQNSSISGSAMPSFYILEMAKTNNAKVLLNRNINVGSLISFASGQIDLNGNNILLSTGANLSGETESNRIIGPNGGFIEITQNLNSPNGSNPGGLGASITSSANLGAVTIRRGHTTASGTGLTTSINRYYEIVPTNNSGLNATLRMKYFDAELNGQNENSLVIYQSSDAGANWNNLSKTSNNTNSNYVEKTGVASFALQTLANNNIVLGGVTGLTFTGQRKKPSEVQLNWTTQTETNMSGYQVQRKLDNEIDFSDKTFVNTLAPNGTSNSVLNYQNIDANSYTGVSYYRLKIIDQSNNISYSNIISVAGKSKGKGGNNNNLLASTGEELLTARSMNTISNPSVAKISVGPNPNNGNFWFSVNGIEKETIATLYTVDGKQVQQFKVYNLQQQKVNGLRSGVYILKVSGFEARKIIVNAGIDTPIKISQSKTEYSKY